MLPIWFKNIYTEWLSMVCLNLSEFEQSVQFILTFSFKGGIIIIFKLLISMKCTLPGNVNMFFLDFNGY